MFFLPPPLLLSSVLTAAARQPSLRPAHPRTLPAAPRPLQESAWRLLELSSLDEARFLEAAELALEGLL